MYSNRKIIGACLLAFIFSLIGCDSVENSSETIIQDDSKGDNATLKTFFKQSFNLQDMKNGHKKYSVYIAPIISNSVKFTLSLQGTSDKRDEVSPCLTLLHPLKNTISSSFGCSRASSDLNGDFSPAGVMTANVPARQLLVTEIPQNLRNTMDDIAQLEYVNTYELDISTQAARNNVNNTATGTFTITGTIDCSVKSEVPCNERPNRITISEVQ